MAALQQKRQQGQKEGQLLVTSTANPRQTADLSNEFIFY